MAGKTAGEDMVYEKITSLSLYKKVCKQVSVEY